MRKKALLALLLPTLLCSCGSAKTEQDTSFDDGEMEESVLQARIDSGYFDKDYYDTFGNIIIKNRILVSLKHEISISEKLLNYTDFPELDIDTFVWKYTTNTEDFDDNYRMSITIQLAKKDNDEDYIKQIKSLINNTYVYDVILQGLYL